MRGPAIRPVVIAAGGTGGHFFPAEALAQSLIDRGAWVVLMTDARSAGLSSSVFAGHERFVISGAGIAGRGFLRGVRAAGGLLAGIGQARKILARLKAGVVVGFGGYPSVAPVTAARLLPQRPAIVLHEQNAVLGRANRALARGADALALSFPGTSLCPPGVHTDIVGNPVRPAIAALSGRGYAEPGDRFNLLVLGGSLGARVLSDVVPAAIAALPVDFRARLSVTQQCRSEDLERVRAAYADCGVAARLAPFFEDVAALLEDSHLVIARAGASTVAELAVAGRPAILVPLPHAIDDHQSANARALAEAGGAWVMPQAEFTTARLAARVLAVHDDLALAATRAATLGRPNAAESLADLVERTLAERVK